MKFAGRALILAMALAALLYAGDYVVVRLRAVFPRLGSAYDSVQMVRLYAIPLKNGRTEYELDARQPEVTLTCVRALGTWDTNPAGICDETVTSRFRCS